MRLFNTRDTSLNKYSIDTVLEKYIGRKKELIQIEAELEKLIKKINEGHFSLLNMNFKNAITVKELNECAETQKINSLFKKLFQLKNFELIWSYTPIPNASTPAKSLQILDRNYKANREGVHYNKNLSIFSMVHTGLITHSKMNAGEILAIILHEVGHNFYQSVFQILRAISPGEMAKHMYEGGVSLFEALFYQLSSIGISDFINAGTILMKVKNLMERGIDFLKLRVLVNTLTETLMVISIFTPSTIKQAVGLLSNRLSLNTSKINPMRIFFLYNVEKHADSFAVDYGYGKQLASALNKLDRREDNVVYDIPVYNWIMDFDSLLSDIILQPLSGYPSMHDRQTSALKRLKEARKDPNLPSNLKHELDEQIKEFDTYYDNYMDISNDENKKRIFTWTYRSIINTVFKGNNDIRQLLYRLDKSHPIKDKW